jgi:putative NIF3 family GTP cyclohydrolase 1 type 2
MSSNVLSRRNVVLGGIAATSGRLVLSKQFQANPTAADVVERIQKMIGIPWRAKTVDKIVAGRPDGNVTGIATTMMATLDVLKHAAAAGKNLVITHETPFYMHQDETGDLADDATFLFKEKFIREHDLTVFHFHDHWHARRPDGIAVGMMRALGWTHNADQQDIHRFVFPGVPLLRLTKEIQSRLDVRTMRVVGDPKLPVHRALASWGYVSRMPGIPEFRENGVDVLIAGETREWELVEYVQDFIAKGDKKALILLGHVVSEQAGMKYCADWLRSFVPEVPIEFIPTPEPFWSPNERMA